MPVPLPADLFGSLALDARFPVLLLPVSVQVKFAQPTATTYELRVRFYPDQLSISTHEGDLTQAEQAAGQHYWQQATQDPDKLANWRPLVARYGAPRAQWIVQQTANAQQPSLAPNDERWTRAAEAHGLPDRFVVLLYTQCATLAEVAPGPVREQLFTQPGRTYDPATVRHPTTEFLQLAHVVRGQPLPADALPVGPNPKAPTTADADPAAIAGVDAGNRWTVDFEEAVRVGMGVRVNLSQAEYQAGFKRLLVLGVRANANATPAQNQTTLQHLLRDHYYTSGLALVPQGTPTNNTETGEAGYHSRERADAEGSFSRLSKPPFSANEPWNKWLDGQHWTTALGLAADALPALANAQGEDIRTAQAMNGALWPATYGYFLEEMLRPLLSAEALTWTRRFFETYVLARGSVPALRVGSQPYGVLPTTRFSAWKVAAGLSSWEVAAGLSSTYAQKLQRVLAQLDVTWTERLNPQRNLYQTNTGAATATNLVVPTPAPATILGALGLDATSSEYYQRYLIGPALAQALNDYTAHLADTPGDTPPAPATIWPDNQTALPHFDAANNALYQSFKRLLDPTNQLELPVGAPPVFRQFFQSAVNKLADAFADEPAARRQEGVLLDDQPLSETAPVAPFQGVNLAYQDRNWNYIHWLANASFEEIRLEDFQPLLAPPTRADPTNFTAPNSLFYGLLRQAVLLAYWEAAKTYLTSIGRSLPADLSEKELFNVTALDEKPRWAWLYEDDGLGAGAPLYSSLRNRVPALTTYLQGVEKLAPLPTAQLERLLAEHLDLGSYRLDAWRLAPVTERLVALRQVPATAQGNHLGAFGWLEEVRPTDASVPDSQGLRHDPDNLGYIHAPSLTHGTAAAILRQGYKSRQLTADPSDPAANRMAVDISSQRVRAALALLEGLRGGHSLGTLLGQAFERDLHAHAGTAGGRTFGSYVAAFRTAFPLAQELALPPGQAGSQRLAPEQAARQVVDGAALLRAASRDYPYGVVGLPPNAAFQQAVEALVRQLADSLDALGDLSVSEGIYQAARGNTDRANAVLESIAKGKFPPSPEIIHPPQRHFTLTHRVLIHLPADTTVGHWPSGSTPRLVAAPRLNAWLAQFFPQPSQLLFDIGYWSADQWYSLLTASLDQAALHAIDLLYLLDEQSLQTGSAFDHLLLVQVASLPGATVLANAAPARLAVHYGQSPGVTVLRRLLPLLARLRQLVGTSRPTQPADLQVPSRLVNTPLALNKLADNLRACQETLRTTVAQLAPNATGLSAAERRATLYLVALFGVAEAVSALAAADGPALLAACASVYQAVQPRLAAATTSATSLDDASDWTTALEAAHGWATALFGSAFRPDVEFALPAQAQSSYVTAMTPAAATQLLRHYPVPSLALQEWLHGMGMVREAINQLDKVLLIQGLFAPESLASLPLSPAQLSVAADSADAPYWLGLRWPESYSPPGDALSLVQWLPTGYDASAKQCALWLDEWTETLPQASQTTALTFHYDQPNTEAPQTMLLVVPPYADPAATRQWAVADLVGAVNETLDLAKKRTVEPDALAFTHLATVLPAVIAPVAQQAVTFTLDLGRVNQTARFREETLSAQ